LEATVLNRQRGRRLRPAGLARFVARLTREVPPRRADSLTLCLVSERKMREYNRVFRGQDRPTDVLSFSDDGEPDPEGKVHLGDIVISVPTAARQARVAGHSLPCELRILALHGYLHLLGYDHERDGGKMMQLQRRLERKLLPRSAWGGRR
jgi:probable rRNA maturation factor